MKSSKSTLRALCCFTPLQSEQSAPAYTSCSHTQRGVRAEGAGELLHVCVVFPRAWVGEERTIYSRPCTYVTDCSNARQLSSSCGVLGRKPLTDTAGPCSTTEAVTTHCCPAHGSGLPPLPSPPLYHVILVRAVDFLLAHALQSPESHATTTHPAQLCCNTPSQTVHTAYVPSTVTALSTAPEDEVGTSYPKTSSSDPCKPLCRLSWQFGTGGWGHSRWSTQPWQDTVPACSSRPAGTWDTQQPGGSSPASMPRRSLAGSSWLASGARSLHHRASSTCISGASNGLKNLHN